MSISSEAYFSKDEIEITRLLMNKNTNRQICEKLNISEEELNFKIGQIERKLTDFSKSQKLWDEIGLFDIDLTSKKNDKNAIITSKPITESNTFNLIWISKIQTDVPKDVEKPLFEENEYLNMKIIQTK